MFSRLFPSSYLYWPTLHKLVRLDRKNENKWHFEFGCLLWSPNWRFKFFPAISIVNRQLALISSAFRSLTIESISRLNVSISRIRARLCLRLKPPPPENKFFKYSRSCFDNWMNYEKAKLKIPFRNEKAAKKSPSPVLSGISILFFALPFSWSKCVSHLH